MGLAKMVISKLKWLC